MRVDLQEFRSSSKRELEENISQLYETVNKLGSKEVYQDGDDYDDDDGDDVEDDNGEMGENISFMKR